MVSIFFTHFVFGVIKCQSLQSAQHDAVSAWHQHVNPLIKGGAEKEEVSGGSYPCVRIYTTVQKFGIT